MAKSELDAQLLARLQSLGKMQARYLWFIVITGLFYWQLRLTPSAELKMPLIDFHLDTLAVLEAGPLVLSFFVLVQMGAGRAYNAVTRKLGIGHDRARL